MEFQLPNIRKLFKPDPGYMLFDCDLSGADAQVVAWEAEDVDLKAAFRAGMKIHAKNATDIFGKEFTDAPGDITHKGTPKGRLYDQCKRGIHLTNYGGTPFTMNLTPEIGWPVAVASKFQSTWFRLHPGVKEWHERVNFNLQKTRQTANAFGYRIVWFDRIEGLLPQALAWGPQSTVAEVTYRGLIQLCEALPWVDPLLQVHDSIVFQVPFHRAEQYDLIIPHLRVEVPYPDPLFIPWGVKTSAQSWGDAHEPEGVDFKRIQGVGV